MYAFSQGSMGRAVLVFRFPNKDEAVKVLAKNNIKVLSAEDVHSDAAIKREWDEK